MTLLLNPQVTFVQTLVILLRISLKKNANFETRAVEGNRQTVESRFSRMRSARERVTGPLFDICRGLLT